MKYILEKEITKFEKLLGTDMQLPKMLSALM